MRICPQAINSVRWIRWT